MHNRVIEQSRAIGYFHDWWESVEADERSISFFAAKSPAWLSFPSDKGPASRKSGVGREDVTTLAAVGRIASEVTEAKDLAIALFCAGAENGLFSKNHCNR